MNEQELALRHERIYTRELASCIPFHKIGHYAFRPSLTSDYSSHAVGCVFCQTRLGAARRVSHPDAADLAELISGDVSHEDAEQLNRHLESSCETCKATVQITWFRRLAGQIASVGASLLQAPIPAMHFAHHFSSERVRREPLHAEIECQGLEIRLNEECGEMLVRVHALEPRPDAALISLALIGGSDTAEFVTDWRPAARWHATARSSDFLRVATEHPELQLVAILTDKQDGIIV